MMHALIKFKAIFWCIFFPFAGHSQSLFDYRLFKANLSFEMPKEFVPIDSAESFQPVKNVPVTTSDYKLVSQRKDLVVYVTIIPYDTSGTAFIRRRFNPNFDRRDNWTMLIKAKADSTQSITHFGGDTLAKLNTSAAGIYSMKVDYPYRGIYKQAKVLFLSKLETADVELIFFYLDEAKIDDYVSQVLYSFKFK